MAATRGLVHQAVIGHEAGAVAAAVAPLVAEGLGAGRPVALLVGPELREALAGALGHDLSRAALVEDAGHRWRGGRGTLQDLARDLRRLAVGGEPVELVEEPVWATRPDGQEWLRFEAAVNDCFADAPCRATCAYVLGSAPEQGRARVEREVRRTHPWLLEAGGARRSPDYVEPGEYLRALDPPWRPRPAGADCSVVRSTPEARALARRVGGERSEEVVLAVHELVSNALRASARAEVAVWEDDGARVWEVADDGPGLEAPVVGYCPAVEDADHGRGLWLVRAVADAVAVRPHGPGTAVRAWFGGSA